MELYKHVQFSTFQIQRENWGSLYELRRRKKQHPKVRKKPGANPTYDRELQRRLCKIYNSTISLVRFKNKNMFFYTEKNVLANHNDSVVFINSKVVGSAPGSIHI
jgi:hypothetical protein